ncbi:MAG TPA: DUF1015 domain-containing protein [Acidimicrobiales bacterium]|nr:DUF1015 domain-containing protein [Acidimicrobiales bacterium]
MPRFEPFRGLRYDRERVSLADVTAPPYDVIDERQRAQLATNPRNAVRIDLPIDEDGEDRYHVACRLLHEWQDEQTLVTDEAPTFTVYRMTFTDEAGHVRHTTGVIGALELWPPGAGEILPHEHTTPKAKSDRLDMLRSCRYNLSAIWGLSLAEGLTELLPTDAEPDEEWTDPDGVTHTVWTCTDAETNGRIAARILREPIVIADGHHRYETSLQYRDERRVTDGPGTAADLTMCFVVELVEDELTVQPIHRLITGLPDGAALHLLLSEHFEVEATEPFGPDAVDRLVAEGALGLVDDTGTFLLRPRPEAFDASVDLDTVRLEQAREALPSHELHYQHGVANVLDAVASGEAQAALLMRPATVAQIQVIAHGGDRMPPKTTFFAPKPATGIVFRSLD